MSLLTFLQKNGKIQKKRLLRVLHNFDERITALEGGSSTGGSSSGGLTEEEVNTLIHDYLDEHLEDLLVELLESNDNWTSQQE